jgi:pimeloyl-ACP methyl ester carboxylesterase
VGVEADGHDATSAIGVVVVVHGGQSVSTERTSAVQLSVLRMIPVARAIRRSVGSTGIVVRRPRFQLRGWNGAEASPVHDLETMLDRLCDSPGPVPVVLVGHSMGARAALRAAAHPLVSAVAGLAPWLPPGEPVAQLAGRRVMVAHGSADTVTSPSDTWAYAQRARSVTPVAIIEVGKGNHAMLSRARLWHRLAAEFARAALALPAGDEAVRDILTQAGLQADRTLL